MEAGAAIRRATSAEAPIVLHERAAGAVDADAWDAAAIASGGSFLGSWRVIRAERVRSPVRVFGIVSTVAGRPITIGQCAVALNGRRIRFLDRIHLRPGHAHAWTAVLRQVVARCGPGTYVYGSPWNHEPPRLTAAGAALPGRVDDESLRLDCVDFTEWTDFAAYRRAVSENLRRDYKKAAAASPIVTTRFGLDACRDVPALVALRKQVMRRNDEPFSAVVDAPKHALKLMCLGEHAFISSVEAGGRVRAAFFGVRFGDCVYYVAGGTEDRCEGFGSYLFLTLIERWFAERPGGALYLGATEPGFVPETYTRGNLLYRRKLRARSVDGTAFSLHVS
jgi:hypothetical protein